MNNPQGCANCGHTQKCHAIGGEFVRPDQTCMDWTPMRRGQTSEGGQVPPEDDPRCCKSCLCWSANPDSLTGICKEGRCKTLFTHRCALWVDGVTCKNVPIFRNKSELPDDDPWRNHPDAPAEGWCKIPVIIAKQLRSTIDCVVPNTLMKQSNLTNSNLLEMGIYLDDAVREGELDV